jgi:hypothetical protein
VTTGLGQQGLGPLGGAALRHDLRERALLVESKRVHAVDHDRAGQWRAQRLEQRGVTVEGHRDQYQVRLGRAAGIVRTAHPRRAQRGRGLLGPTDVPRADHHRQPAGKPAHAPATQSPNTPIVTAAKSKAASFAPRPPFGAE